MDLDKRVLRDLIRRAKYKHFTGGRKPRISTSLAVASAYSLRKELHLLALKMKICFEYAATRTIAANKWLSL